jgi:hypothetical protein
VLLDWMMPRLNGEGVLAAVAVDAELAVRHAYILVTANAARLPAESLELLPGSTCQYSRSGSTSTRWSRGYVRLRSARKAP